MKQHAGNHSYVYLRIDREGSGRGNSSVSVRTRCSNIEREHSRGLQGITCRRCSCASREACRQRLLLFSSPSSLQHNPSLGRSMLSSPHRLGTGTKSQRLRALILRGCERQALKARGASQNKVVYRISRGGSPFPKEGRGERAYVPFQRLATTSVLFYSVPHFRNCNLL